MPQPYIVITKSELLYLLQLRKIPVKDRDKICHVFKNNILGLKESFVALSLMSYYTSLGVLTLPHFDNSLKESVVNSDAQQKQS